MNAGKRARQGRNPTSDLRLVSRSGPGVEPVPFSAP